MSARANFVSTCLVSLVCQFAGSQLLVDPAPGNPSIKNQEPQRALAREGPATIVDKTPAELVQALPELAGLEPAASHQPACLC